MVLSSKQVSASHIYMVGIKGTGMSALAELLLKAGAVVSGSDVSETFYTDEILRTLSIPVYEGFSARNLPERIDLLIHSPAYSPETHPELIEAKRRGLSILDYPQALAAYARNFPLLAVSGVHGKTTVTAMAALIIRECGFKAQALVGSGMKNFNGSAVYKSAEVAVGAGKAGAGGDKSATGTTEGEFFLAETCEYRRHFLNFEPKHLVVTNIEEDHLDYFRDIDDVYAAFETLVQKIPPDGSLVYCADNPLARKLGEKYSGRIRCIAYGFSAEGDYRITKHYTFREHQFYEIGGFKTEYTLKYPGDHSLLNATAALALIASATKNIGNKDFHAKMIKALAGFQGTRRRSEIIFRKQTKFGSMCIIDDYAHHPTAIQSTLAGFRELSPHSTMIVDFMPHTYSRTASLLPEFAKAFAHADVLVLNGIYASAREQNPQGTSGKTLFQEVQKHHSDVYYIEDFDEAAQFVYKKIKANNSIENFYGDFLFVTMGAGDNWRIGRKLAELFTTSPQGVQ